MFDKEQLIRLKPLFIFFLSYTALFFLFAITLKYTFPFVAGFLLALVVQPLIRTLKSHLRMKSGAASALSTLIVYIVLFGIIFLLGYWLIYEINNLLKYLQKISQTNFSDLSGPINYLFRQAGTYLKNLDGNFIQNNREQLLGMAQSGAGIATTVLGTTLKFLTWLPGIFTMFIVMIFSTYFFSKDMGSVKARLMSLFSKNAAHNIRSASHHGVNISGKYVCSYLLIYFITFVETLIVFSALGVPYPLVISIITGIADVLPVLGPGTIYIPMAFIYLICGDFFRAGALIVCWLLITAIRQIIEPKIISSSINVHPLTMLAAIYFALIANNFWILIYFSLLIILYQILTHMEILPTLFEQDEDAEKPVEN
ncbi:MAG TPA: sporulation integral membrane protein YtvI [Caproiciproducens sp.]|nr:sporulation integral membrane protein YtvI [Caproiciproducens sp.]